MLRTVALAVCVAWIAPALADETTKSVSWKDSLARLEAGNQRFVAHAPQRPHQDAARLAEVAKGQSPFAVILGCADSRLAPEILFDQGLGDLFVVRVAGNLADPFGTASIEYAVEHLGSRLVVVLGHERCGAVKAACDAFKAGGVHAEHPVEKKSGSQRPNPFLEDLVTALLPSVEPVAHSTGDFLDNAVVSNVKRNVELLRTQSPILRDFQKKGLKIVGARYDLDKGTVKFYESP